MKIPEIPVGLCSTTLASPGACLQVADLGSTMGTTDTYSCSSLYCLWNNWYAWAGDRWQGLDRGTNTENSERKNKVAIRTKRAWSDLNSLSFRGLAYFAWDIMQDKLGIEMLRSINEQNKSHLYMPVDI